MKRSLIALTVALAMLSMTFPGQVTAHESTATDLNDLAYDQVWPVLGPGGATDTPEVNDALNTTGLHAERAGGDPVDDSCTHHDPGIEDPDDAFDEEDTCDEGNVETMVNFQCQPEDIDADVEVPMSFFHSDLENGIFEATGSFFVPVHISGEDADQVDQVHFGFAHTFAWPLSSSLCQQPFPLPGAYYEFYRGDLDGSDGWEIPVNTLLVPDAPYGAILRLLDDSGNTLGAGFVYSNVNNYLNDANWRPGTPTTCDQSGTTGTTLCPYHDVTPPRAIVYDETEQPEAFPREEPGTTERPCTEGVALEYGEPLADSTPGDDEKHSPAIEITDSQGNPLNYFEYYPPERDVDSVPLETTATDKWGPGFCITQASGEINVKAWDQSGNIGSQTITDA